MSVRSFQPAFERRPSRTKRAKTAEYTQLLCVALWLAPAVSCGDLSSTHEPTAMQARGDGTGAPDARSTPLDASPTLQVARMEAGGPAWSLDSACSDDASPTDASEPPDDTATEDDAATQGGSVRELLDWVLASLADGHALTHEEVEQHFDDGFLLQVPEAQLVAVFAQLHDQLGEFSLAQVTQSAPQALRARLDASAGRWNVDIQATATSPRKIVLLYLRPITDAPAFASYAAASQALQTAAAESQLLVAEVKDGACAPINAHNAEAHLAIGSAFKLWVLLALESELRADPALTWETQLTIRDELKSFPSGVLQDQPAGTELSLREFAAKMISISDNTAADHLIDFLGRDTVERAQLDARHSAPEANIPWLDTRALFALKVAATSAQIDEYRGASVEEKRSLLDPLHQLPIDPDALAAWRTPRMLDLEWFANAFDLCAVLSTLAERAELDAQGQLLRLLAINPGLSFDSSVWTYVGYKGGSEPGVLNMSWLLRRADGRWFSLVLTLNDSATPVDEARAIEVAAGVAQLLGDES